MDFYSQVRDKFDQLRLELSSLQEEYEKNEKEYLNLKSCNPDKRIENKNELLYYKIRDMYNGKIPSKYLSGTLYFFS